MEQEVASFFWGLKKFACVADQQSKLFDIFVKTFCKKNGCKIIHEVGWASGDFLPQDEFSN
jgi:hypothetical protein